MAAPIKITRTDLDAAGFRRAARRAGSVAAARRMLALALVMEGVSRTEAAQAAGMDRQTLRDWVHRYNVEGLAGLTDRHGDFGPKPRLSPEQEVGVWGVSERRTYVRPCRATCRGASALCDIYLRQKNVRPAWGTVAVAKLRSCAAALQLLVHSGLHRFSVRLLPSFHPRIVERAFGLGASVLAEAGVGHV